MKIAAFTFMMTEGLDDPESNVVVYAVLRAIDTFHATHGHYPGTMTVLR